MIRFFKATSLHRLFEVGLALKGFNGLWETAIGLAFLLISKASLSQWYLRFTQNELIEDPHDHITNFIVHTLLNPGTTTKTFAALYVLFHGLLNLFLAVQLYRDKHWAYPTTIGVVIVSVIYQIYRISVHHSLILTAITIFDLFFIILIWHEYKHHVEQKQSEPTKTSSSLPK